MRKKNLEKLLNKDVSALIKKGQKLYCKQKRKADIDLGLTENPFGCSLLLEKAFLSGINDICSYPEKRVNDLKKEIARFFNLKREMILLGNGADSLIDLVCRVFINKDDKVVIPKVSFPFFRMRVEICGGRSFLVEMRNDLKMDVKGLKKEIEKGGKLVFIANPNNPTGELIKKSVLIDLIKSSGALFVLDEANIEFGDEKQSLIKEVDKIDNLIVIRSFSKGFGLAGLRIGFLAAKREITSILEAIFLPFPVSNFSLKAAKMVLKDKGFIKKTKEKSRKERRFLVKNLKKLGFKVFPSESNNLLVKIPKGVKRSDFFKSLQENNIGVIQGSFFDGLDDQFFRISVQSEKINKLFISAIKNDILKGGK